MQIESVAKKARQKRQDAAREHEDPKRELRALVKRRRELIRTRNALEAMSSPRVARKDCPDLGWVKGDVIPPSLGEDLCETIKRFAAGIDKPMADGLSAHGDDSRYGTIAETESAISRELKALRKSGTPDGEIAKFLDGIAGLGDMTAAILIASIDFSICVKPDQLIRFCGMGHTPDRSRLECKAMATERLHYVSEIRTALWNAGESMAKASTVAGCGVGSRYSTKYLEAWRNYAERMKLSPRLLADHNMLDTDVTGSNAERVRSGEWTVTEAKRKLRRPGQPLFRSAAGFIRCTGRWKCIDSILYDLYLVGRAAHGLPVHVTWHEKARQRRHGTNETINPNDPPRMVTIAEALEMIGYTGKIEPLQQAAE
jgi:uncharacterized protein YjiS (DUF1127 family)